MLRRLNTIQEGTVWFKSGRFYSFHYTKFQNDPIPTVIMINAVIGTHPTTGHYHNYIQAINLSYVSRNYRKKFVDDWLLHYKKYNGDVKLTWETVEKRYPFIKFALRRYLLKKHFLLYAREIKDNDIEREVISTWLRDYSMMAMKQLAVLNNKMFSKKRNTFTKSLSKHFYRYQSTK